MIFLLADSENKIFAQDLVKAYSQFSKINLFEINSEIEYLNFLNDYVNVKNYNSRIIYFFNNEKINFKYLSERSNYYGPLKRYNLNSRVLFFTRQSIPEFIDEWFSFINHRDFFGNIDADEFFKTWITNSRKDFKFEGFEQFTELIRVLSFNETEYLKPFTQKFKEKSIELEIIIENQKEIIEIQQKTIEDQINKSKIEVTNFTFNQINSNYLRSNFWKTEWRLIGLISIGIIILLNYVSKSSYLFLSIASVVCISIIILKSIRIESEIEKASKLFIDKNNDFKNSYKSTRYES